MESCLVLERTSLGHTHGICSSLGQRYIALDQSFSHHFISFRSVIQSDRQGEKSFTWDHARCVKMSKKHAKNWIDLFVIFANEK